MACSAGLGPVTADQQPAALLKTIVDALDRNQIPYMVVGSFASTFHGEPRTTQDLDLVIDPTIDSLQRLVSELDPSEFYVDADTARDALDRRTMFNIVEMATAWKVDLVIRRARPFSIEELARRQRVTMLGVEVAAATAEDTIIAKLEWAKAGNSDRQLDDVAGILRVRGADIDQAYIAAWVSALQLESQWERARAR